MIAHQQTISVITVDPKMDRSEIAEISNKIYEAMHKDERNIGIIFSADMSHALILTRSFLITPIQRFMTIMLWILSLTIG